MLAVRLHAAGEPLVLEELPSPDPIGTEVWVRIAGCGVCRTDLHIARGEMSRVELPLTLGHEVAGWIETLGPAATDPAAALGLAVGDPVLIFGGWGCGACGDCAAGDEQRCATGRSAGFQADGGYAEAILVPHPRHLVPLGTLDPVIAGPLADAGATTLRAVRRAQTWLRADATAAVIGVGGLGQFALQHLRRRHPALRIAAIEPDPERRELAATLGADVTLPEPDPAPVHAALGAGADAVFDLVGTDATLEAAGHLVGPGGLVMLVGEGGGGATFGFGTQLESWWTTTTWASVEDLREVVSIAQRGELRWQSERMPLVAADAALRRLEAGTVRGRLVLVPPRTA
jgi:alcohol dehydrogenase, propanol-preferring